MYTNYIFDLYGTLVDIRTNERKPSLWKYMAQYMTLQGAPYAAAELKKACHAAIEAVREEQYAKQRTRFPELSLSEIEPDFAAVVRRLYLAKNVTPDDRMISAWALMYRTVSLDYVRLYDGAKELLLRLKQDGKKVFLLSNAQRLFTEPGLRALGIYELFDDVFISSDIGFLKPSAHFYGALLERHGLVRADSVMIGNDWKADAWGAHDNGLASMYVHTAQSPALTGELPPDCRRSDTISQIYP